MSTTIKDVAREANVGVGTVSRVLNDSKDVNLITKQKVLEAIAKLNYVPSEIGKRLRKNKTKTIALLIPVITDLFFTQLTYYVENALDKYGYTLLLVSSQQRISKENEIVDRLKGKEVDGALVVTHFYHDENEFDNCNIVSIDRHLGKNIPYVTSDNYDGTKKALKEFIKRGAKRIGFIGSKPLVESEVSNRIKAYNDVMDEYKLEKLIVYEAIRHGEEENIVNEFLNTYQDVDALFISGYSISQVAYKILKKRGITIPNDIEIICYDENFVNWIASSIPITCVKQDIQQMAEKAVEILINEINGKEVPLKTIIKSTFISGITTK